MSTEEIFVASALNTWNSQIERAGKAFLSLSDEQLSAAIAPGKNRVAYLWAHLIAVQDAMLPLMGLGDAAYPAMFEAFVKGADKDVTTLPTAAELKQQWADVNARTSAAFGALTPAGWLERHTQVSAEDFAKAPTRNRLSILLTRTSHIGYHLGQVVLAPK